MISSRVRLDQTGPLESALIREFYADAAAMRAAIEKGRAFNVIHYGSSQKFDIFPVLDDPYYEVEFSRRRAANAASEVRRSQEKLGTPIGMADSLIAGMLPLTGARCSHETGATSNEFTA